MPLATAATNLCLHGKLAVIRTKEARVHNLPRWHFHRNPNVTDRRFDILRRLGCDIRSIVCDGEHDLIHRLFIVILTLMIFHRVASLCDAMMLILIFLCELIRFLSSTDWIVVFNMLLLGQFVLKSFELLNADLQILKRPVVNVHSILYSSHTHTRLLGTLLRRKEFVFRLSLPLL